MEMTTSLLSYTFHTYCQGTRDHGFAYALVHHPSDASFNNIRSRLFEAKHRDDFYEIDVDSVEDCTIR